MKLDLPFPDGEHAEPVSMVLLTIRITSFVNYLLVHVSVYDWMALLGQEGFETSLFGILYVFGC